MKFSRFLKVVSLGSLLLITGLSTGAMSATISIINSDGPGEGLNDPTPVAPVTGNSGTTLGQQRLKVFQAAANYWGNYLRSSVVITIEVSMDPLSCDSRSAMLGAAGPNAVDLNFSNAPRPDTLYPAALANSLAGRDLDPTLSDIGAQFNSAIDNNDSCLNQTNWWYGIGGATPSRTVSLYDTVLHEIGHGLGFLTFVGEDGTKAYGYDDHFMQFLRDDSTGKQWPLMSDSERYASARGGNLVWTGANVVNNSGFLQAGKDAQGRVRLFAPNPYESGSSVSHWDTSLNPNELMEPYATLTSNDTLTKMALKDMGWQTSSPQPSSPPVPTPPVNGTTLVPVYHLLLKPASP